MKISVVSTNFSGGIDVKIIKIILPLKAMRVNMPQWPMRVFSFYRDGFRQMTVGKKLWVLILIKLIIMFGILRMFFFPDVLKERYPNDTERASAVRSTLIERMGQT